MILSGEISHDYSPCMKTGFLRISLQGIIGQGKVLQMAGRPASILIVSFAELPGLSLLMSS